MFIVKALWVYLSSVCITRLVSGRPLKVLAKGYTGKTLPPGGWTHWFNVDFPDGAGDFETYDSIVRLYGRTCMGIPCRRPLAVKAVSIYGRSPRHSGGRVTVNPRQGLKCYSHHQDALRCDDYKVRFYCPNLHTKCNASFFYPHHHHLDPERNTTSKESPPDAARVARKQRLLVQKQHGVITGNSAYKQPGLLRKRRAKRKKRRRKDRTTTRPSTITSDVYLARPNFLSYHPRHPAS